MAIQIQGKQLKNLIKESLGEILKAEAAKLRGLGLPFVSEREQKDIEKRYGKRSSREKSKTSYDLKI